MTMPNRSPHPRFRPGLAAFALCVVLAHVALPARAQDDLSDVFGNLGTAETYDEEAANAAARAKQAEGHGSVLGQVFDGDSGTALQGVTVILQGGSDVPQYVVSTDLDGSFEFASVPPGSYSLSFVKSGYRTAAIQNVEVQAGGITRNDFPMPRLEVATSGDVLDLDAFVVDVSVVGDMMDALDLRLESDSLLNVMSSDDFSRFAAGDVAEALKRVSGVNIVEGQFAIIRGLEDRYSSTLYNGAVVPSPDPDRQSVQLDLFPSDVLVNTVIAKSFTAELPGNSAGGSIDVITHDYPEDWELQVSTAGGINENAWDHFQKFEDGNPAGIDRDKLDTAGGEVGVSGGGRHEMFGREFRIKGVLNWEVKYKEKEGIFEEQEPVYGKVSGGGTPGDLALGELNLTKGRFDWMQSDKEKSFLGYLGFGFDLDESGDHKIDGSYFHVKKRGETVELRSNGYIPGFNDPDLPDNYGVLFEKYVVDGDVGYSQFNTRVTRDSWIGGDKALRELNGNSPYKPAWWTNFNETRSFLEQRALDIAQLNGDHTFSFLDDLHIDWAANYATTQQTGRARGMKYWFEPDNLPDWSNPADRPTPPITVEDLGGAGHWNTNGSLKISGTDVKERQGFGRIDGDYENDDLLDFLVLKLTGGGWYEYARRTVDSDFLEDPRIGNSQFFLSGDTPPELGLTIEQSLPRGPDGVINGTRISDNESTREVIAGHLGLKSTFFEDFDVAASVRIEKIKLVSKNDPFTDAVVFGAPRIYPNQYVLFDRLDNVDRQEVNARWDPTGRVFNDQLLGLDLEPNVPCTVRNFPDYQCLDFPTRKSLEEVVNGRIDKSHVLPSAGIAYRPIDGLSIRGVYSETVARPSFREMGYYVTEAPGKSDLYVGNPLLELSEVRSYDGRAEYTFGDSGDLVAFSAFYKQIQRPIERIVLRDALNFESSTAALFRTYFNNPNDADLWGIEVEGRKTLDFLGIDFLEYFSLGGNYTYIEAEVKRSDEDLRRAERFFLVPDGTLSDDEVLYTGLEKKRRLFGQPKWIANANVSFEQPDWGSRVTLAYFAISDVLDAAGSSVINQNGNTGALTLDEYTAGFYQLDLIASQKWTLEKLGAEIGLKFSVKNLTDSTRKDIYDPSQLVHEVAFRKYKVGRSYKLGITVKKF